jgi:hypothetical protein
MKLTQYSGKRIALVMDVQGREVVLRGTAAVRLDAHQGHVLQVTIVEGDDTSVGRPVFLISESRWRPHITGGWLFDCDYCLDLSAARHPLKLVEAGGEDCAG